MVLILKNDAHTILRIAQLEPEKEKTVATCIRNYADPGSNCFDKIAWVAYRIWNAVKAIFGMSDWQVVTSIIKNKVYERENADDSIEEFIESKATEFANSILNRTLAIQNYVDDGNSFFPATISIKTLENIVREVQRKRQATLQAPSTIQPPVSSEIGTPPAPTIHPNMTNQEVIDATPEFKNYKLGKGKQAGYSISAMSLRPANLFFRALGAPTTMPGSGELFRFLDPEKVRNDILNAAPNAVVEFTANQVQGYARLHDMNERIYNLGKVYGNNIYRISYKELQDTLASQKIHLSQNLPKEFYTALKTALLADAQVVLPGNDVAPVRLKDLQTPKCREFINKVSLNPEQYGLNLVTLYGVLNSSLYQIGSMVVKTEDYRIFADGDGQIFERHPGEQDAIRLINACGIRAINHQENLVNKRIMTTTFQAALKAAENGLVVFPAVGMGVWRGDPEIYWNAFLDAVMMSGDDLEAIFINPRHQKSINGNYLNRDGDEFAEILEQRIANPIAGHSPKNLANLKKIVNLYDKKTDLLQLAHNLKKANPDKIVSLFNASDPDVTLGNHVTEYMNNLPHRAPTTEEHYSMLGTNGLCFESITGIHQEPERIIGAD
jgi:hypothetical protein